MARKIPYEYEDCRGNVPTKPLEPVDWVFLMLLTVVATGLCIFALIS